MPSGKWLQRAPRSLHKNLARLAKIEGVSFNQLVVSILSDYAGAARATSGASIATSGMSLRGRGMGTVGGAVLFIGNAITPSYSCAMNAYITPSRWLDIDFASVRPVAESAERAHNG